MTHFEWKLIFQPRWLAGELLIWRVNHDEFSWKKLGCCGNNPWVFCGKNGFSVEKMVLCGKTWVFCGKKTHFFRLVWSKKSPAASKSEAKFGSRIPPWPWAVVRWPTWPLRPPGRVYGWWPGAETGEFSHGKTNLGKFDHELTTSEAWKSWFMAARFRLVNYYNLPMEPFQKAKDVKRPFGTHGNLDWISRNSWEWNGLIIPTGIWYMLGIITIG